MFEDVRDEDLEQTLLRYIDMPYFRNNPSYILLWQRYYANTRDPGVLFLMKYKKVSQYYHWIYVELSRFFISRNHPGLCSVVLSMGMKCNAYDSRVLADELGKIPANSQTYSGHEITSLMSPKGFHALGRVWNSYNEVLFYNQSLFITEDGEISFEEFRSMQHKEASGPTTHVEEDTSCVDVDTEVVVDGSVFRVKDILGAGRYRVQRVTEEKGGDAALRSLLLCKASEDIIGRVSDIDACYVPGFTVETIGLEKFLFCEYRGFGALETCLDVSGEVDMGIVLYFADQLIDMFGAMVTKNLVFSNFTLDSVCVTEDCRLMIADFDWTTPVPDTDYSRVVLDMLVRPRCAAEKTHRMTPSRIKNEVRKIDLKRTVRRHRVLLYERLCSREWCMPYRQPKAGPCPETQLQ